LTEKEEAYTGKRDLTSLGENPISRALAYVQNALVAGDYRQAWDSMIMLIDTPGDVDLSGVGKETIREKEHQESLLRCFVGVTPLETWIRARSFYEGQQCFMRTICYRLYSEITTKLKIYKYFDKTYGGVDANKEAQNL
jgi:hypothetical protein